MKKYIFLTSLVFFLFETILPLSAQENVGIGTVSPMYRLDVQGNPASTVSPIVNSMVNYVGNQDILAYKGMSVPASGFGLGGSFSGGSRGAEGIGMGGAFAGSVYGLHGSSTGTAGTRYGMYGTASGGATNYGVYGNVSGGANHFAVYGFNTNLAGYAGYFNGRGHFTQELRADKNLIVDDTTWTSKVWNQSGILGIRSIGDIEIFIDRNNNGALSAAFEIFNGIPEHVFLVSESGSSRTFNNHLVDNFLGVGTLSPTTRLQILGGSDVSLTGLGFAQYGSTTSQNMVMDDNEILVRNNGEGADLYVQYDGGNLILCGLEQGAVGIGVTGSATIPAGYLLAVDGRIITEELRIQNSVNWPDYVFTDQYQLMSLDALKKSIQTHKHLPNIPSASEVEDQGILIGDMQKRMMEKIEELTLYILQLHETNKHQQAEIEDLKANLQSLREE
jgi:hypothetical protein